MSEIDVIKAIEELDKVLATKGKTYTLYTCGGAALIFLGYDERRTGDIDLIITKMDKLLTEAAKEVADKLGISSTWLNNKVAPLEDRLPKGWKKLTQEIFAGESAFDQSLDKI